jgi:polar amino acid transport system ATP-binding protein
VNPIVRVANLTKSFGPVTVLDGINLTVDAGRVLCIIGPSGGGKSTLLRCLNGLETPDEGFVFVNGECLGWHERRGALRRDSGRSLAASRARIGMVFQSFNLFPNMTAIQNVALGLRVVQRMPKDQAVDQARRALDAVGLAAKYGSYPRQLSGGQQQRVAIARALAMKPSVMLFDEPTSALDPELVGEVLSVMESLAADGMTMLVATHEMSFARDVASTVAVMDGGRIIESGPPTRVLTAPDNSRTAAFLSKVRHALEP